ncbi:MAG: hypothetical protein BGO90_03365 [Legionella sp. 40-6]|nr:MAG: hypothetical protein BGO90_03365 [Legionella sp. 40-6]
MIIVLFELLRAQTNDATHPKKKNPISRFKTLIATVDGCDFLIATMVGKKYKTVKAIVAPNIRKSKSVRP